MPEQTNPTVDTPTDAPTTPDAVTGPDPVLAAGSFEPHTTTADAPADSEAAPVTVPTEDPAQATPPPSAESTDDIGPPRPVPVTADRSTAAATTTTRSLTYAVDIVFCIDVTGSMTPIIDAVKANALRFYDDVQANLTDKGKNVDELRVRVIAFRDFARRPRTPPWRNRRSSPCPRSATFFSAFVDSLVAEGGGDAPGIGSGGRRPGDQFAVDHPRRPAPAGHRGVDRSTGAPAEFRRPATGPGELGAHRPSAH